MLPSNVFVKVQWKLCCTNNSAIKLPSYRCLKPLLICFQFQSSNRLFVQQLCSLVDFSCTIFRAPIFSSRSKCETRVTFLSPWQVFLYVHYIFNYLRWRLFLFSMSRYFFLYYESYIQLVYKLWFSKSKPINMTLLLIICSAIIQHYKLS